MKEAAGEANITVITIVLVALVMTAGAIIIPKLIEKAHFRSICSQVGGVLKGYQCKKTENDSDFICQIYGCGSVAGSGYKNESNKYYCVKNSKSVMSECTNES